MPVGSEQRARKVINGYGDGGFRIAGERVEGSIIVFPERFMPWPVADAGRLQADDLQPLIEAAGQIDILLLGCGAGAPAVDPALRGLLREHGILVDVMDTGAACRTFNILLTESRAIAAALIAV
ncbi:MAG: Mth938-like domain-containing protein [Proteobacteria bacterium]|nr:Mth938-like domain-containing protein [Pseudomonadota bacterium]MDA1073126.1 Mth938-like domain-containing protein [Pseudomonadota bacterium]